MNFDYLDAVKDLEELDFDSDVDINEDNLIEEWRDQPNRLWKYGKAKAVAKASMDKAWEHEKRIRSKILVDEKERDSKLTAQILEAIYRTDEEHIKAKDERIKAEYIYNLLDIAVQSFHHRKAALEGIMRVRGMEYFSEPEVKDALGKKGLEVETRSDSRKRAKPKAKR